MLAHAGAIRWKSGSSSPGPADDGVSRGRFEGAGGNVLLSNVTVAPETQFGHGVQVNGPLYGSGSVPEGVTVEFVTSGRLYAELAGPGWLSFTGSPSFMVADVVGNIRIGPNSHTEIGWDWGTYSYNLTIEPTGLLELANSGYSGIFATLTNYGTIRITDRGGLNIQCNSRVRNYGLIQITELAGLTSGGIALVPGGTDYCDGESAKPRLVNEPGGTIESWAVVSPTNGQRGRWENHGTMVARGGTWLLRGYGTEPIHTGTFSSSGDGHLVLCGLFLLQQPASVADNVGLADGCGTVVADVTDFTPQQIQDVRDARLAAMSLYIPPVSDEWPPCYFRGVDLTELFEEYPDICVYRPQDFAADAFEFYISWLPGFGAALDIGHAIFGMDLAGRPLSTSERILAGFFAVVPGDLADHVLTGIQRLRRRADNAGTCQNNSFVAATPVVLADGTTRAISELRPSDLVLAADPETGVVAPRPVTHVIVGTGEKQLVDIDLSTGERITATIDHPIWVEDRRSYVEAGSIRVGDLLRTSQGTYVQVSAVGRPRTEWLQVYNLTVANLNTYFVGASAVLAHNTNPFCLVANYAALQEALGPPPTGGTYQAHHILPVKLFNEEIGQRLHGLGINLNGRENGVWLPKYDGPDLGDFAGSFHRGRHLDAYNQFVRQYLGSVTTRQEAMDKLDELRTMLTNGCLPLNSAGVRQKPARGTCPSVVVDFYRSLDPPIEIEAP